jgi:TPR repeat protein
MYANGRGVSQDDAQAVAWYSKAAEQGDAKAQTSLAWMYEKGRGVPQEDAEAVALISKLAQQGFFATMNFDRLKVYQIGRGVPQGDTPQAVELFRAEHGDAGAQFNLGVMYEKGRGVSQDDAQAVAWYSKAAEQGIALAQFNLGTMYEQGRGVSQDDAQAVVWYRKAAEQGLALAQANLGSMYAAGRGVPKNDGKDVARIREADEQGNARAQANLGTIYEKDREVSQDSENSNNVAFPQTGTLHTFIKAKPIAPLQIRILGENLHYYIKMTDWSTDKVVQTMFIRAGSSLNVKVPLGSFRIKYAVGDNWQGEQNLFGEKTAFYKADKRFDFARHGNTISGHEIELILQPGGNLSTSLIPKSEW